MSFSTSIISKNDLLGKPTGIAKGEPFAGVLGAKPLLEGLHSECKGGKPLPGGTGASSPRLQSFSLKLCNCLPYQHSRLRRVPHLSIAAQS